MIRVQEDDFDVGAEIAAIRAGRTDIGAISCFVGTVRDMAGGEGVSAMTLEHYAGMTEKQLAKIEAEARERWPLFDVLIIHRFGRMEPGENIVLVVTTSAHRDAAIRSCEFLIDWLKTKAPFWKLEDRDGGSEWVKARDSDDEAAAKWETGGSSLVGAREFLIARGKKRGYVTYDEINAVLPPTETTSEQIEDLMTELSELGVNVVENEDELQ